MHYTDQTVLPNWNFLISAGSFCSKVQHSSFWLLWVMYVKIKRIACSASRRLSSVLSVNAQCDTWKPFAQECAFLVQSYGSVSKKDIGMEILQCIRVSTRIAIAKKTFALRFDNFVSSPWMEISMVCFSYSLDMYSQGYSWRGHPTKFCIVILY